MAASIRFRRLHKRITALKQRLIPKTRIAGNYTEKEQDLIRSYRLLAHAEFESYIEDRVIEIAEKALNSYKTRKRTGDVLAALMSFSPFQPQSPPSSLNTNKCDTPNTRVHRVVSQFKSSTANANHGIKESNIIGMLFPIGFVDKDLDATFLSTLNSYGGDRGATAHQGVHTHKPIDPVSEVATVTWITNELQKLDLLFSQKKRES